jgi:hypothetical protein
MPTPVTASTTTCPEPWDSRPPFCHKNGIEAAGRRVMVEIKAQFRAEWMKLVFFEDSNQVRSKA